MVRDGVIDAAAAERIQAWQASRAPARRWPVLLALALGGVALAAGLLLFVASNWDALGPGSRYALLLATLLLLHGGAAATAESSPGLSAALHAVGTAALGAGIFLAGQVFNLEEHWPSGALLWSLGALAGWLLLRQWPQAAMLAVLAPGWLVGEWSVAKEQSLASANPSTTVVPGLLLLACAYLGAERRPGDAPARRALSAVGALALLPLATALVIGGPPNPQAAAGEGVALVLALGLPLAVALGLRGRESWPMLVVVAWVLGLWVLGVRIDGGWRPGPAGDDIREAWTLARFGWLVLGAAGLAAWGVRDGIRARVNLGVAGFMVTLLFFYFSSIMDKLGRSLGLMGLGVLLLGGGWLLERGRRRLLTRMAGA